MDDNVTTEKLTALRCSNCDKLYVAPRFICKDCDNDGFLEVQLQGKGEIYSFTIIHVPSDEFIEEAPYAFVEVMLDEDLVIPGRLTNEETGKLKIKSKVSFIKLDQGINWFELK